MDMIMALLIILGIILLSIAVAFLIMVVILKYVTDDDGFDR